MQFPADTDLADALDSPRVVIRPLLEVDWNRNGYTSGTYTDLSKLIKSVDVDFASIHGDLPSEINTVVGSSSGIMTVVLSGRRKASEMRATQLLSKYYQPSPLFPATKEGTPIRYSRVVKTVAGFKTIRQFTGWISEYVISEEHDEVTLTCSDVYDLQTELVTLPLWARGPEIPNGYVNGFQSQMNVIDVNWVFGEVLRQAGRSIWPAPRSDAVAAWSCAGSMLPSVGTMADADGIPGAPQALAYYYGDSFLPFRVGKYDLATEMASWIDNANITASYCRTSRACFVADRGGTDPFTYYIGFSGWFYSTGVGGTSGNPSDMMFGFGAFGSGLGYLTVQVYPGGTVWLSLFESPSSGSSNAGTTRTWKWDSAGANTMPVGWHYVDCYMTFTNAAVTVGMRVDEVAKTPNVNGANSLAFKYYQTMTVYEQTNPVTAEAKDAPMQHVQIWHGNGTPPFVSGAQHPSYVQNGQTAPAVTSLDTNWLTHIPDRIHKYAWSVLKEAVEGGLGVMITREDGQLWIMGRDDAYIYGLVPTVGNDPAFLIGVPWFIKNPTFVTDPAGDISRSKISGLDYNPSADTYRNTVAYHIDVTKAIAAIVYESNDPKQFFAKSGSTNLTKHLGLPSGTIAIYAQIFDIGITPSANKPPLGQTSVSAVNASSPGSAAAAGWLATVYWNLDQRGFNFGYGAGVLSPSDVYVGSFQNADQANLQIGGWKYDNSNPFDQLLVNTGEVASRGTSLLDLGSNDWRQFPAKIDLIVNSLVRDTVVSPPVIRNLSVPADPRRQLLDVVKLPESNIVSGDVYAQIVGKRITDTQHTAEDQLDVRVVLAPVNPAFWDDPTTGWDIGSWQA